jgi:hypothetical protein
MVIAVFRSPLLVRLRSPPQLCFARPTQCWKFLHWCKCVHYGSVSTDVSLHYASVSIEVSVSTDECVRW